MDIKTAKRSDIIKHIRHKQKKLKWAGKELKKHFVGLDKIIDKIIKECEESGFRYSLLAVVGSSRYFLEHFEPDFEHGLPPEKKTEFEKNSKIAGEQITKLKVESYNVTNHGRGRIENLEKYEYISMEFASMERNFKESKSHNGVY